MRRILDPWQGGRSPRDTLEVADQPAALARAAAGRTAKAPLQISMTNEGAGASTTAARDPGRSKAKAYGEDRDAGSPATESPGDHGHQPSTSSALTDQREVLVTPR